MAFRPAPEFRHDQVAQTAILFVNLGTPEAATADAVRRYLAEFLSDRRVVEIPAALWKPLLHGVILRTRPRKSAAKYATVWRPEGSPLLHWTRTQARLLEQRLASLGHTVPVRPAMRYGQPSVPAVLDELQRAGSTRILVLPAYPQYSGATTGSAVDAVARWSLATRWVPEFRHIGSYHDQPAHIDALAHSVREHWATAGRSEMLVMSFHGMPERTLKLGDPYHCQCHKTARLLAEALSLEKDAWRVTFQSRFGRAKWLDPATEPTLVQLAKSGVRRVDVLCPGFSADCLETLEEINQEARAAFLNAGGEVFGYIPCLNDHPRQIDALATLALQHLHGWPTRPEPDAHRNQRAERARAMGAAD